MDRPADPALAAWESEGGSLEPESPNRRGAPTASAAPAKILRVLVVDSDRRQREALAIAVRSLGYVCSVARDGAQALSMHRGADRPDVLLADWAMPGLDGVELCKLVRKGDSRRPYTHFIFVTARTDKAHFIHAMNAGADDYLAKPVDLDVLQARLAAVDRLVVRDRRLGERTTTLVHDRADALLAARTDALTEVHNRLALAEDLGALAARASRYGHRYCAALCDIDDFKAYNDHFGHLPGDRALRSVADAIHRQLRRGDALYRYGGEEFLAILPEQSLEDAARGMDRVREAVERLAVEQAPGARRPVLTISVGVAALGAASTETTGAWLRRADDALYVAKSRGRNCVAIGGPS